MTLRSPAPPGLPASSASVAQRVDARVRALIHTETERWEDLDGSLDELFGSLRHLVEAGGKRLRPAFCFWGFVAAGGDPEDDAVIDVGAAFEMLHAFALVHDDVMDGSDTRRGRPTAHVSHEARHRAGDWRGEPRRFGEGVAILAGDLAHVYADLLLDRAAQARGQAEAPAVRALWHELRVELNVGQYLDVLGTARADRSPATARRVALYKSGRYTVERPLHLGAALAGWFDAFGPALSAYGGPLGEAFQLRDDVLGAFGDPAATGKPAGPDLREGKPTPLLALAYERSAGADRAALDRVGRPDLSDDEVAAIQAVVESTGALLAIEERVGELMAEAVRSLELLPAPADARQALEELAVFVASRSA